MDICLRVLKESNKSRFDSYSVRNSVLLISHITFRDCRVHIFSDNLSRNSRMQMTEVNKLKRNFIVSREAEVLHRWESKTQTFGFLNYRSCPVLRSWLSLCTAVAVFLYQLAQLIKKIYIQTPALLCNKWRNYSLVRLKPRVKKYI